ncbi:1-aminocyclopropane-1-carboxylate deaminase deaminase [Erwinia amylovora Ea644]|nr:1-aminocyclopropane-1-carboxylate deaminase deaminase [Erwinia amylovora Ea644]CCP07581.1 D-cysteine desulfhydrase [Erwinia amylovora MR1]
MQCVLPADEGGGDPLALASCAPLTLWDEHFATGYGHPNEEGKQAVKLLARLEGIFPDPVYTGKAVAGLFDGITQHRFRYQRPLLFVHTGAAGISSLIG